MHGLQPLDDLRGDVLELVDQQMTERRQRLGRDSLARGRQYLGQLLEGAVEGHQPLLVQAGLEVLPEQCQGLDEHPFPGRTVQRLRL
ncbi:hypothetical protein D3C78_975690 [compost metagenome]